MSLENRRILLKGTAEKFLSKEGEFFDNGLAPLMKVGLKLRKNVLKPLAESALIPSGLTAAASAIDAAIQKTIYLSGVTTLIISNEEMEDIMKIVKYLEESGLLIKGVSKTIGNEEKG